MTMKVLINGSKSFNQNEGKIEIIPCSPNAQNKTKQFLCYMTMQAVVF